MDLESKKRLLEELAWRFGVEVVYESMASRWSTSGGLCRLGPKKMIIVDANAPRVDQIGVLLDALGRFDLDSLFVPPIIRRELLQRRH